MFVRIAILVAVVHWKLFEALWFTLAVMAAATAMLALGFLLLGSHGAQGTIAYSQVRLQNPFSLRASIRFALLFAAVLVVVALVRRYFPGVGLFGVSALAGSTDVDAITLSMAQLARDGGDAGAAPGSILVAALANTLVKCGLVGTLGSRGLLWRVGIAGGAVLLCGIGALVAFYSR
jgi:uncharacterized membrane protein (DUF4010 family)